MPPQLSWRLVHLDRCRGVDLEREREHLSFLEPTSHIGPGPVGTVFGDVVYHNFYAARHRREGRDRIHGVTEMDAIERGTPPSRRTSRDQELASPRVDGERSWRRRWMRSRPHPRRACAELSCKKDDAASTSSEEGVCGVPGETARRRPPTLAELGGHRGNRLALLELDPSKGCQPEGCPPMPNEQRRVVQERAIRTLEPLGLVATPGQVTIELANLVEDDPPYRHVAAEQARLCPTPGIGRLAEPRSHAPHVLMCESPESTYGPPTPGVSGAVRRWSLTRARWSGGASSSSSRKNATGARDRSQAGVASGVETAPGIAHEHDFRREATNAVGLDEIGSVVGTAVVDNDDLEQPGIQGLVHETVESAVEETGATPGRNDDADLEIHSHLFTMLARIGLIAA